MTTEYGRSDEHKKLTKRRNKNVKKSPKKKIIDQDKKRKLRHSRQWRELKRYLISKRGEIDEITGKKIIKDDKLTCHHMRLTAEKYGDFSNPDDFMLLAESTHQVVHWLWQLTKGEDFSILDKLRDTLKRMKELEDEDSRTGSIDNSHGCRDSHSGRDADCEGSDLADIHDYEEVLERQLSMVC